MIRIDTLSHALTLRDLSSDKLRIETLPSGTKLFFKGKATLFGATGKLFSKDGFTITHYPHKEDLSRLTFRNWITLINQTLSK